MSFLDEREKNVDDLEEEIFCLKQEIRTLNAQLAEYKASEKKSAARLLKADKEADELKKTSAYKYLLELKNLKLLSDKFKSLYKEEAGSEKAAITDLLNDFLKDINVKKEDIRAKEIAKSLGEKLGIEDKKEESDKEENEEFFFDLDEAINPSTPLDLEELCKELGVFSGDDGR